MATKPKTYTAKNKIPGYDTPYKARTPQGAGRAAKAGSDQAKANEKLRKAAQERADRLSRSGMSSAGKEVYDGIRGRSIGTKKQDNVKNQNQKFGWARRQSNKANKTKGK